VKAVRFGLAGVEDVDDLDAPAGLAAREVARVLPARD
jgi:hypothetical protein